MERLVGLKGVREKRKAQKIGRVKQESEVTADFVKVDPCFGVKDANSELSGTVSIRCRGREKGV